MFMTMNGKVKIASRRRPTAGCRGPASRRSRAPAAAGSAGPPGSRMKRIPKAMYRAPNIGKTMNAADERPVADLAHQDVREREAEHQVDEHRQRGQLDGDEEVRQVAPEHRQVVVDRVDGTVDRQVASSPSVKLIWKMKSERVGQERHRDERGRREHGERGQTGTTLPPPDFGRERRDRSGDGDAGQPPSTIAARRAVRRQAGPSLADSSGRSSPATPSTPAL